MYLLQKSIVHENVVCSRAREYSDVGVPRCVCARAIFLFAAGCENITLLTVDGSESVALRFLPFLIGLEVSSGVRPPLTETSILKHTRTREAPAGGEPLRFLENCEACTYR